MSSRSLREDRCLEHMTHDQSDGFRLFGAEAMEGTSSAYNRSVPSPNRTSVTLLSIRSCRHILHEWCPDVWYVE